MRLPLIAAAAAAVVALPVSAQATPWDWNAYDWYGTTAQGRRVELYARPRPAIPEPKRIMIVAAFKARCANGSTVTVKIHRERGESPGEEAMEPGAGWRSPLVAYHHGGTFSGVRHSGEGTDRLSGRFVSTREAVGTFSHNHFRWHGTRCSTGTVSFKIFASAYAP